MNVILRCITPLTFNLMMVVFFINTDEKLLTVSLLPESSVIIKGESNINKFECSYDVSTFSDAFDINFRTEQNHLYFSNTRLILKNIFFDCGHTAINKDFNKLLKTEDFPIITLELISAEDKPDNSRIQTRLNITISGVSKIYELPVEVENFPGGIMIYGKLPIDIADFNLNPPKKLLGIIRVYNVIDIEFNLGLKTTL